MVKRQDFIICGVTHKGWASIAKKLVEIRDSGNVTDCEQKIIADALGQCARAGEFKDFVKVIVRKNNGKNEFAVCFPDGRSEAFSPKNLNLCKKSLQKSHLTEAMRQAIEQQTDDTRFGLTKMDDGVSSVNFDMRDAITDRRIRGTVNVDHETPFVKLKQQWMSEWGLDEENIPLQKTSERWIMADVKQRSCWQKFHCKKAKLRALSSETHRNNSNDQATQRAADKRVSRSKIG